MKYSTSHCAILQPRNGTGENEHDVGALEGVTPPQNLEVSCRVLQCIYLLLKFYFAETIKLLIAVHFQIFFIKNDNVMSSIREDVEWLKGSRANTGHHVLSAWNTLAQLRAHCDKLQDEDDEIRAPFYFTFKNKEDMDLFMTEVRDNKNARVSSFLNNPEIRFFFFLLFLLLGVIELVQFYRE